MPFTVPWIQRAPARAAATAAAVARPKSSWPWKWTGTSGPSPRRAPDQLATASGAAMPSVSTTTTSCAPASTAVRYARLEERGVGARAVDAEVRDLDRPPAANATAVRSGRASRRANADRVELEVPDRRLDHARRDAELDERLDVRLHRAEKPQTSAFSPASRISWTARQSSSETRGNPASIRSIPSSSRPRAISSFCSGVEHDADGLLAVAQRRVVEADARALERGAVR